MRRVARSSVWRRRLRVLWTWACGHPRVGYKQGLNELLAAILRLLCLEQSDPGTAERFARLCEARTRRLSGGGGGGGGAGAGGGGPSASVRVGAAAAAAADLTTAVDLEHLRVLCALTDATAVEADAYVFDEPIPEGTRDTAALLLFAFGRTPYY